MTPARRVVARADWTIAADRCTLDHEARFLRRRLLVTDGGAEVLVDLPQTTTLNHGDALELDDGRLVEIVAASEALLSVEGHDLVRLAWHVGNRHCPCQIDARRLLIRRDPVLRDMLETLGATLTEVEGPFLPEGGAYGRGRTHGHAH